MALTAAQHIEIASAYESAAKDSFIPPAQRAVFSRKAETFRLLAKLAAKQNAAVVAHKEASANKDAGPPKASSFPFDRVPAKAGAPSGTETPAHMLALMQLALRWRLFRLETETFGHREVSPEQPVSTPAKH